ncbi:slit homolog 1 isoform X2, partial [Paramuricea clavata]
ITCEDHPCGSIGICKTDSDSSFFCECPGNSFGDGYHCHDTPCYSSPCQNGATCKAKKEKNGEDKEYECDCPVGFTGDDCEVFEIEFPCSERRIVDIPYCEEENDASQTIDTCDETPCKNEGICEPIPTGQYEYRCKCQPGYIGRTCETKTDCKDNSDCKNGGTCESSKQCLCAPGFKGLFCNER